MHVETESCCRCCPQPYCCAHIHYGTGTGTHYGFPLVFRCTITLAPCLISTYCSGMHGYSWLMTWDEAEGGWVGDIDLTPFAQVFGFPCETLRIKFVCPSDTDNDFKVDGSCQAQILYFLNDTSTGTGSGGGWVPTANPLAQTCVGAPNMFDTFILNSFLTGLDEFGNFSCDDDCEPFSGEFNLAFQTTGVVYSPGSVTGSSLARFCAPESTVMGVYCDVPTNGDCAGAFVGGPILGIQGVITLP